MFYNLFHILYVLWQSNTLINFITVLISVIVVQIVTERLSYNLIMAGLIEKEISAYLVEELNDIDGRKW